MTSKIRKVYKCGECGNILEMVYVSEEGKECPKNMEELVPKTGDAETEKHVPYIEKKDGGVLVKVGKNASHPMTPEHYIVYIEICADGILMRKYLKPGDVPEAFFKTDAKNIVAWELCNLHGLWKS
ncbi:MAG: desulfoferrodoxin family protein [Candidatus Methanomethylophilaceae archaeon]|jgi:superoxide reductase